MDKQTAAKLFTEEELAKARRVKGMTRSILTKHREYLAIVTPAMERINKLTGQTNDSSFIAYVLEYAVT